MTRIVTVPFRNDDEGLWTFIEKIAGKPVNGTKIRALLYDYKGATEQQTRHDDS